MMLDSFTPANSSVARRYVTQGQVAKAVLAVTRRHPEAIAEVASMLGYEDEATYRIAILRKDLGQGQVSRPRKHTARAPK